MKRNMLLAVVWMTFTAIFAAAHVAATEPKYDLFVAPDGDDAGPGTIDRPLATLAKARDAVRQLKKTATGPIRVAIRGGTYYLAEPVVFTPGDSGTEKAPIVYVAYHNETSVISGGAKLDLQWKPYRDGILQAAVPAGMADFDQLFCNGRKQRMARYPNFDPQAKYFGGFAADCISPERAKRWADPAGGFVHAMHRAHWGDFHYEITGVDDDGNVKLEGGYQNNRRMGMHGQHRFVENIFEELDVPGEWFLDKQKKIVYFFPPNGIDPNRATIEVARLRHLFEFRGSMDKPVRHITLSGLTLRHTRRTFMEIKEQLLRSDWCIYRGGAVLMEGVEECTVGHCFFDAVGGNGVFVSNYARGVTVTGCKITEAGGNGVCFVGDPAAVRSPSFEYHEFVPLEKMDTTPGPKTANYPAKCLIYDNLIHSIGRVHKQSAAVQISMAEEITVSHNSIYHLPRAGINISEGTWGGHVIEFNDVFDTVRETGDHGSFNSWGRDRFWSPDYATMSRMSADNPEMPKWDARKTTVIRNNRWRCDHGWDIDLDDGSSNYLLTNNLCLNGGIKLREGFYRTVENNIMVGNSFHPHVWFQNSGDRFVRNIVGTWYRPIRVNDWGKEVDHNLLPDQAALEKSHKLGLDENSAAGDPMFVDPAGGDFRVNDDSPALKLGFENFPMDQFGVVSPELRAEARTPQMPGAPTGADAPGGRDGRVHAWLGAKIKNVVGQGEMSAHGLPGEIGVLLVDVPEGSTAAKFGLKKGDAILHCDGKPVKDVADLLRLYRAAAPGAKVKLGLFRSQKDLTIEIVRGN
ncbi:MAG: PDZ domain-containing protein [Candidatus Nealsonbacteria bacterium]|nr:PDZ domain-containing protein [Candidatus Nealsonbacteria bacterium]